MFIYGTNVMVVASRVPSEAIVSIPFFVMDDASVNFSDTKREQNFRPPFLRTYLPTVRLASIYKPQIGGKFTATPGGQTNIFYGCVDYWLD